MSPVALPQPPLTIVDRLFILSSLPIPVGALVAFVLRPRWQLAVMTLCFALVVVCLVISRRRRRLALAMRESSADAAVQRAAANIHLQEVGLLLLAVALLFAAVIPFRTLY